MSEVPSSNEQSSLESPHLEELNMEETGEVSEVTVQVRSEVFSFEEAEEITGYSYSEEEIEPSTDEELRLWRYPRDKVWKEEDSVVAEEQSEGVCIKKDEGESSRVEKEKRNGVADGCELPDIQHGGCYLACNSAEIAGSSEVQEDEKPRPGEEEELESESCSGDPVQDQFAQGNRESCEGCCHTLTKKTDQKDGEDLDGKVKQTKDSPFADVAQALKETQTGDLELETNIEDVETRAKSSDINGSDGAQCLTESQVTGHVLETLDQDAANEREGVVEGLTKESRKAEGAESAKKVTFILEPELINDCTLSESNTSMESTAETHMSGEEKTKM